MALVGVVAATAVFAITSLAAARTYQETVVRNTAIARTASSAAMTELLRDLHDAPTGLFHEVHHAEPPRSCLTSGTLDLVMPGDRWDLARCGAIWDYDHDAPPGSNAQIRVAWDLDNNQLGVRALTANGVVTGAGWHATLQRPSTSELTVATADSLDVNRNWRAATDEPIGGAILHSAGAITGDATGIPVHDGEGPAPLAIGTTIAAALDGLFTVDTDSTVGSFATVAAHVAELHTLGCPEGGPPQLLHADDTGVGRHLATYLCLAPGRQVIAADGTTVDIHPQATAFLVDEAASDGRDGVIQIAWTTRTPDPIDCPVGCVLRDLAQVALGIDTHPGGYGLWDSPDVDDDDVTHGRIDVLPPSTGVVATTHDTYVGACLAARTEPLQPGDHCNNMTLHRPVTIVAGTPSRAVDLTVGATIRADVPVGLIATGDLVLGSWARPPAGALTVEAAGVALGRGTGATGTRSAIRTSPTEVCTSGGGCQTNVASSLHWHGALAAPHLALLPEQAANAQYEQVAITPNRTLAANPPPHFPGMHATWRELARIPTGCTPDECPELNDD